MGERVAITGAAGFLGGHLVRGFAARGWDVVPIVRAKDARAAALPGARTIDEVSGDPRGALSGVGVVVHAAAVRHRYGVGAGAYRASNVELVRALVGAAAAAGARRFVHVSSVGVYGFPARLPVTEEHPYAPATLYSLTKVEAERLLGSAAREAGIEPVIVRPTIVYGPGDDNGMLDKTARMLRAGTYRIVGSGANTLHHTHVDDIVEGIALAARHPAAAGEGFILCGPETITLARFSELVARALGTRVPRVHVPLALARAVATAVDVAAYRGLAFTTREPPINHEKLDVMTRSIAFSSAKAKRLLGFVPRVGYEEGIARTLRTLAAR